MQLSVSEVTPADEETDTNCGTDQEMYPLVPDQAPDDDEESTNSDEGIIHRLFSSPSS